MSLSVPHVEQGAVGSSTTKINQFQHSTADKL